MKNIRKTLLFLTVFVCIFSTQAFASLFYDLSGDTNIYWTSSGVSISSYSSTGSDDVDFIQVYSHVYVNGSKYSSLINAYNNDNYTKVSKSYGFGGNFFVSTQHDAMDWTGDEQIYTSDSYNR